MLFPSGNPFKCHEEVLYLQPLIPPKRFDIFSPDWGMLRRSRRVLNEPYLQYVLILIKFNFTFSKTILLQSGTLS